METIKQNHNNDHKKEEQSIEQRICFKSPEWAEHARFEDDDYPCDDGRAS